MVCCWGKRKKKVIVPNQTQGPPQIVTQIPVQHSSSFLSVPASGYGDTNDDSDYCTAFSIRILANANE